MKWAAFTLLSALHITLAQKWKILGADRFETDEGIENLHGDIVTAVKQAFVLAETAFEVLNNNFNDPKVQSMVHHILGDGERLGTNLVQVQNYFNGVLQYQKEESTAPTEEFNRDTDLLIFCDASNYERRADGKLWLKVQELPHLSDNARTVENLFTLDPDGTVETAQALTTRPDSYTEEYQNEREEWLRRRKEDKDNGIENNIPQPSTQGRVVHHADKPNTIDIATWFLKEVVDGKSVAEVDPSLYENLGDPEFVDDITDGGRIKLIDALAGESSLPGLLLHELTHTNLAGVSVDMPDSRGSKGYGWDAVGELKDLDNADSLAMLAICMFLFKGGFWVEDSGNILRV